MNLDPILNTSPAVQIHLVTAVLALGLGTAMWVRKKGTKSHKMIGRAFVLVLLATAVSSIFIRHINNGNFSFIHIFVPITFIGSFQAVYWIRQGNIRKHLSAVRGMFFGALLIPGFLAFLPGRLLWKAFFG